MPSYIPKLLKRMGNIISTKLQYSPPLSPKVTYRSKIQVTNDDDFPKLSDKVITLMWIIVGAAFCLGWMLDCTILVSFNAVDSQQISPMDRTLNTCTWSLDYIDTHPNYSVTHNASDMHLGMLHNSSC